MIIVKFVKNVACLLMCLFNKAGCISLLIMLGSSLDVAKTIWQAFFSPEYIVRHFHVLFTTNIFCVLTRSVCIITLQYEYTIIFPYDIKLYILLIHIQFFSHQYTLYVLYVHTYTCANIIIHFNLFIR